MSSLDTVLGMFKADDDFKTPASIDFSPEALRSAIKEETEKTPRASLSLSMDIGKNMYEKGLKKLQQKEEKLKEFRASDCSFSPTLNQNSLKILSSSPRKVKEKKEEEPIIEFGPKVKFSDTQFLNRNYELALETYKKRITRKRTPSNEKLDDQCTFNPKINENSKNLRGRDPNSLHELKVALDQKLQEKKKEREEKKQIEELRECTFTPQLKKRIYVPKNVKDTPQKPKGYSYKRAK